MTVEALERPLDEVPHLEVTFRRTGRLCVLTLRGDLQTGSVGVLEAQIDRLGRTPCHRVVVDLHEVDAIDATGARVLIGLRHYVHGRGGTLTTLGARALVSGVLAAEEARSW
ncbi:MAG TPA: STAS domain-containing protein [Acidimicrobiales bacterium]|nr:STAS domain-containing protein [Acidimicrobiales bacterium]